MEKFDAKKWKPKNNHNVLQKLFLWTDKNIQTTKRHPLISEKIQFECF